jgi:CYTH domain-containing protein
VADDRLPLPGLKQPRVAGLACSGTIAGMATQIERERRYLLEVIPAGSRRVGVITQGYFLAGSRFEIRVRTGAEHSAAMKITTSAHARIEFETRLPACVAAVLMRFAPWKLTKLRYHADLDGRRWDIDSYLGRHEGLICAETEHGPDETVITPAWARADVTGVARYTNKNLARS